MRLTLSIFLMSSLAVSAMAQQGSGRKWHCDAKGIAAFAYDGGDYATIRLMAYSQGGSYRVKKNDAGDAATGVTADGTSFTCNFK